MPQAEFRFTEEEVTNHLCRIANNNGIDASNKLDVPHMNAMRLNADGSFTLYHDEAKNGKPPAKLGMIARWKAGWHAYRNMPT